MMFPVFRFTVAAIAVTALVAFIATCATSAQAAEPFQVAQAEKSGIEEKEAFEAAKELGTIEAWEAFLNNFPKGFRADLARAYVRRLGSEQKSGPAVTPAPAAPPATTAPAPVAPQQAVAPPPAPLSPVDMGRGNTPWRIGTYELDEGRIRTKAAIVDARGVRLTAYCSAQRTVPIIISDLHNGIYPDFDQRVEQGLTAAGGGSSNSASIPLVFQNGQQVFVNATLQGLTGELVLGDSVAGFNAGSPILEQIMGGNGMTVSMPPFGATFQLTSSRNAMCSLLRSCGAANFQRGCAAPAPRPVVNTPAVQRPPVRNVNCTAGRVFSRNQGKCVCPRNEPFFFGGRCRASRDCPGDSALNSRGQCVKQNEPPRQQQVDTCPGDSSRNAQGICVKDNEPPRNTFVPDCPGGMARNAQGQCVRSINPQNEAIKLQCNLQTLACAAGNKSSCKKAASLCDRG